jgi:hypothetical protein
MKENGSSKGIVRRLQGLDLKERQRTVDATP